MDHNAKPEDRRSQGGGRDQRYGDTRCPDCGTVPGHYRHLN